MEYTPSFRDQLQNGSEPSWRDGLSDELYHHGIKGMHWGVRRPRNEDGIIQGAGASLAKKQKKLRAKAADNKSTARFSKKMADDIQRDADAHGAKARATKNIIKKAGHRAAQLWDANAAEDWRQGAKKFEKKAAKQDYKADKIKAKRELQDWGDKANARYAKDKKYRESGQIGLDAEKAVDRYNAAKKAAKKRYKQTINADKIARLERKRSKAQRAAGRDSAMRKHIKKQNVATRMFLAPTSAAAATSQAYNQHRANKAQRRINRLSN